MTIVKDPGLVEELRQYERNNECCEEKLTLLRNMRAIYDGLGNNQVNCFCPDCENMVVMYPNRYDGQVGFDCDNCQALFLNDIQFTKVFTYNREVLLGF